MSQLPLEEITWGIIGAGDVCEVKSGPAFMQILNSNIKAVMRRNAAKAADFAQRHSIEKWYDNADDLLNDLDINAIYIATPPSTHAEYTLKAAAVGKPVYVEKPMARTHAECLRMIEACEEANVPLYMAYYRRALPNILKVKELIDSGAIGEVRGVSIDLQMNMEDSADENWRVDPAVSGGGHFFDLASHQLDALDFLLGPITEAKGFSENQSNKYSADDITIAVFKFENGILGKGLWAFNTSAASQNETTTIIGSKGKISFPFFGDAYVLLEVDNEPAQKSEFDLPKHIQQPLIQTVVDDLRGVGICPSTGVSGARASWVMDKIVNRI